MRPLVQNTPKEANETFEEAVQPYMGDLKKYCCSLMKSTWDGEDLLQDTLLKAYKSWSTTFKPISKSFLFRIACNAWIDGNRKRKPIEDFNQDITKLYEEKAIDSDSLMEAMQLLLQELSPKQRIAMLLVDGLSYTIQEAATMMETSEGAVKAVLHRARRKLKLMKNQDIIYSEDNSVTTYITAFQNGNSEKLIDLFQTEVGGPRLTGTTIQLGSSPQMLSQSVKQPGASFIIVSTRAKNGCLILMPFTHSEWIIFFKRLTERFSFAA